MPIGNGYDHIKNLLTEQTDLPLDKVSKVLL